MVRYRLVFLLSFPYLFICLCLRRFRMDFENAFKKIEREVVFYTDRCTDSYTYTFPQLMLTFFPKALANYPNGQGNDLTCFLGISLSSFFHSLLNLQHQLILLKDLPHRFSQSTSESPSLHWAIIRSTSGCALSLLCSDRYP